MKQDKYNKYNSKLENKLHNVPGSCVSKLTDKYSIGYVIKYIGHYENIKELFDIGNCLKAPNLGNRTAFNECHETYKGTL